MCVNSHTLRCSVSHIGAVCSRQCSISEVKSRPALCDPVVVFFFLSSVMWDCFVLGVRHAEVSLVSSQLGVCAALLWMWIGMTLGFSFSTNKMQIRDCAHSELLFCFCLPVHFLFVLYHVTHLVGFQPFSVILSPFPPFHAISAWLKSLLWGESKGTELQAWMLSGCVWLCLPLPCEVHAGPSWQPRTVRSAGEW